MNEQHLGTDAAEAAGQQQVTELAELRAQLNKQQRTIRRLEQELAAVTGSKVWRTAEFFRRLIRVQLLHLFPSLQSVHLPAARRWSREYLLLPLTRLGLIKGEYQQWQAGEAQYLRQLGEQAEARIAALERQPLISLVMPVYNVKPAWLLAAVQSVQQQWYGHWQLCIADDCSTDPELRAMLAELAAADQRIEVRFLEENQGIAMASNAALAMARGEFVGFLDNDDELAPHALLEVVRALDANPELDCIYSDEDKLSESGHRYDPFFKPDWSPDTLRSYNYLCHFTLVRRQLLERTGGFRAGFEGSQDYDLFLRVSEQARQIGHIPQILYHWRAIEGSVGKRGDAKMYAYKSGRKALREHLARLKLAGRVEDGLFLGSYRIHYRLSAPHPLAIIIPSKDQVQVLKRCVDSILERTSYQHYRIYIVDNGSEEEQTFAYYRSLESREQVHILHYNQPFNFSAINNFAVGQTSEPFLLFLNNDTEVISPTWLEEMLGHIQRPEVGAVGSLLYYANNTVQHGGVILGIGGVAGHAHKYAQGREYGYFGRLKTVQNLSAVTAACLLTRRSVFAEIGGFEEGLSHAFNDVDLCLRIRRQGYLIVYTPFAELYHHESISRGYENTPEKMDRFKQEREFCEERWDKLLGQGDPYYNPHLSLSREDFSLDASWEKWEKD
ncbi:glycosyltransferase family 2 protein [Desulfogranum mediterraneum]|uniref:glycosyltransferase family 2 protein n=1 Tax=Desulfogranum mediterraneum TaxID=160661 RepID=UPI000401F94C|nr:glycosyltransferase family 2 protein [Desulfogranum mediterraneum]